jgi:hypothetical protein
VILERLRGITLRRRLVGEQQRLARVRGDLVELFGRAVETHLCLLLVRDDVRGLFRQAPVLLLRLLDCLFQLRFPRKAGPSCTSTSAASA